MASRLRLARISSEQTEQAKQAFSTLRDRFLTPVLTPARVVDGAAIVLEHFPRGKVLDVGCGQGEVFAVVATNPSYECSACDDLRDSWHRTVGPETLLRKMRELGVAGTQVENAAEALPFEAEQFAGVFCCDVIEHLHHTPRFLLQEIHRILRVGGVVAIGMPNSVNLRKRIDVLRGRTNYVALDKFWNDGLDYRGHVREYTPRETWTMLEYAGFTPTACYMLDWHVTSRLRGIPLRLYKLAAPLLRTMRDSYVVVGRKGRSGVMATASAENGCSSGQKTPTRAIA